MDHWYTCKCAHRERKGEEEGGGLDQLRKRREGNVQINPGKNRGRLYSQRVPTLKFSPGPSTS